MALYRSSSGHQLISILRGITAAAPLLASSVRAAPCAVRNSRPADGAVLRIAPVGSKVPPDNVEDELSAVLRGDVAVLSTTDSGESWQQLPGVDGIVLAWLPLRAICRTLIPTLLHVSCVGACYF